MTEMLKLFKQAAKQATGDDLTYLRLYEELLVSAIRSNKYQLDIKRQLAKEINRINKQQLALLGQKVS